MTYAVISIPQAKRIAKAYARAQAAITAVGELLASAGVAMAGEPPKTKKPRKTKAPKVGKSVAKTDKPTDPLTA